MGYWTTIHFFDDKIFKEYTVPMLRKGDIHNDCIAYLRLYQPNTVSRYTPEKLMERSSTLIRDIQACAQCFDEAFKRHDKFDTASTYEECQRVIEQTEGHYDFVNFFEYIVFQTCADFYPHLPCGRYGHIHRVICRPDSIAETMVRELGKGVGSTFFHAELLTGIISWLSAEEVKLLYYDKENIKAKDPENAYDKEFLLALYMMIDIAMENNVGLLLGAEMSESVLCTLPSSKVIPEQRLKDNNLSPLILLK